MQLVLSLFPGIDLLGRAFEEIWGSDICVVRGPDVIFGGDIRDWHVPAGKFDGVIGGPPCQCFSDLARLVKKNGHKPKFGNLIPEFVRCVEEAQPKWFLMENVKAAPTPNVWGYHTWCDLVCDYDCGGHTMRKRLISFGTPMDANSMALNIRMGRATLFAPEPAVTGGSRVMTTGERIRRKGDKGKPGPGNGKCLPIPDMLELQGLPRDSFGSSLISQTALRQAVGNGVPMAMGRSLAKAVKEAVEGLTP
jgi:DNA (cytosine-5)-methyltransferase 1